MAWGALISRRVGATIRRGVHIFCNFGTLGIRLVQRLKHFYTMQGLHKYVTECKFSTVYKLYIVHFPMKTLCIVLILLRRGYLMKYRRTLHIRIGKPLERLSNLKHVVVTRGQMSWWYFCVAWMSGRFNRFLNILHYIYFKIFDRVFDIQNFNRLTIDKCT